MIAHIRQLVLRNRRFFAHSLMLLVAFIWGVTFIPQVTGMETLSPLAFNTVRFIFGAAALLPFALMERRKLRVERCFADSDGGQVFLGIIGLGVMLTGGSLLQQISLFYTSVANAAFLTTLYVPLVPIFGLLIFGRNIIAWRWAAVAVFVIGSSLMTGASTAAASFGDIVVIISAAFWAGQIIIAGWLIRRTKTPLQLAFSQTIITAFFHLVFLGLADDPMTFADIIPALPELFFVGVVSSGLAFALQMFAQRFASNTATAILFSLEGIFASVTAWVLLGQVMAGIAIFGAGLIFAAVLIIELTPDRSARR